MREILFRGKRVDNGKWIEGYVYRVSEKFRTTFLMVKDFHACSYEVDPETIGQYTGLTDKNGKQIFEGDVVHLRSKRFTLSGYGPVIFSGGRFTIVDHKRHRNYLLDNYPDEYQIVGNIHDNPELMEAHT